MNRYLITDISKLYGIIGISQRTSVIMVKENACPACPERSRREAISLWLSLCQMFSWVPGERSPVTLSKK